MSRRSGVDTMLVSSLCHRSWHIGGCLVCVLYLQVLERSYVEMHLLNSSAALQTAGCAWGALHSKAQAAAAAMGTSSAVHAAMQWNSQSQQHTCSRDSCRKCRSSMPTASTIDHTAGTRSNHAGAGRGQGRSDSPAPSQTWAAGGHQGQQALRLLAETLCAHVSARSELAAAPRLLRVQKAMSSTLLQTGPLVAFLNMSSSASQGFQPCPAGSAMGGQGAGAAPAVCKDQPPGQAELLCQPACTLLQGLPWHPTWHCYKSRACPAGLKSCCCLLCAAQALSRCAFSTPC